MKLLLTISFFIFCTAASFAQRVPSSCDASDSVKTLLHEDAAQLALSFENKINSSYLDSVFISQSYQDYFDRLLSAFYQCSGLQARDTILLLRIHDYNSSSLHNVLFTFDTTVAWGRRFSQRIFPTGNSYFDSLLQTYGITVDSIWFDRPYGGSALLHALQPLNLYPLTKLLDKSGNFRLQSRVKLDSADGDLIDAVVNKDSSLTLSFSHGWNSCPNACRFRRYWEFTIFPDCSVQFDSSYGDQWPQSAAVLNFTLNRELQLYPNPVSEKLFIETPSQSLIEILDLQGKVLMSFRSNRTESELDVFMLPNGTYFARVSNRDRSASMIKFMKD